MSDWRIGETVWSKRDTLAYRCGDIEGNVSRIEEKTIWVKFSPRGREVPFRPEQLHRHPSET